ncbi:FAD/NAD(P)-binding domain-containing protein [Cryphonectria parasitica EP155]|uniref:FAD/NAD(P)-binding domain-containing protein n=1 Tax=Cryphonectria parasitica (strain ATCC 38755 / EP155) TaxID=660469 RepID=A0A9P5CRV2_CRYP1|nr:FAD/NAD(P)-binding domain-containing protein [Cryphonectria parasitica EP155]KAF3767661.1 FAD/NAD(P)-binding domain-containing protein [Cryphonectria parasitica EP155]
MGDQFNLHIAVIGAGMGGLGCALALAKKGFKRVTVYEHAPGLGFVGAGIQMAPNMARILDRLGCWQEIYAVATNVKETSIRQGSTNEELAHVDMPDIESKYGYPHCTGHRADLAGGMYDGCKREPAISFKLGNPVVSIESFTPRPKFTVKPHDGEAYQVEVDVLLAADGIKSLTRSALLAHIGEEFGEADTGQASYRIMLKRQDMAHDPEMTALLDSDCVVRWIGERRHIIAYPVANKTIYNISSAQPDVNFAKGVSATYTTKGSKTEMLRVYGEFCPLVHRMLDLVPDGEVVEWKLRQHNPLSTWSVGSVALLGDACHPTLPHLSQGAAMAIEDGAVIAEVLSRVPDTKPQTVSRALKAYEAMRKDRTTTLVDMAAYSGRQLHLGEGKAREERDRQFREHRESKGAIPDKWASPDVQKMIYEHDCVKDAAERFDQIFERLVADSRDTTNGSSQGVDGD